MKSYKYFKCVMNVPLHDHPCPLKIGQIYSFANEEIFGASMFGWSANRFVEISNIEKLLIMGGKITPIRICVVGTI